MRSWSAAQLWTLDRTVGATHGPRQSLLVSCKALWLGLGSADDVAGLGGNDRVVWCRVLGYLDDWAAPESSDTGGLRDRDELRAHRNLLLEG